MKVARDLISKVMAAAVLAAFFVFAAGESRALAGSDPAGRAAEALHGENYDKAIELLLEATDKDPFDDRLKDMLAAAYRARGWTRYKAEDFVKGVDDFRRASIMETEKKAETYLGLGYGSYVLKNNDDALYYLYEAVYLEPDDWRGHDIIGGIYYRRGKLSEAIEEWETVKRLAPETDGLDDRLAKARKEFEVEGGFSNTDTYYFNIKYEGDERRELGDMVLDILDRAYREIGSDLGYYPGEPVAVILYTQKQFSDVTDAPSWSSGIFDGNIRLPVGGRVDKEVLEGVLYHEYTHAVTNMVAGRNVPTWLSEGIALYEETRARDVAGHLELKRVVPLSSLERPFIGMSDNEARSAYAQSFSAVNFFVERFGSYNMGKLLKLLGGGSSLSDAVRECTGVSFEEFERYWAASATN